MNKNNGTLLRDAYAKTDGETVLAITERLCKRLSPDVREAIEPRIEREVVAVANYLDKMVEFAISQRNMFRGDGPTWPPDATGLPSVAPSAWPDLSTTAGWLRYHTQTLAGLLDAARLIDAHTKETGSDGQG